MDGSPRLIGCKFLANTAEDLEFGGGLGTGGGLSGSGGALIKACEFTDNFAAATGGGASAGYSFITLAAPEFNDCVFQNNSSGFGGAVYTNVTRFDNCVFEQNSASQGAPCSSKTVLSQTVSCSLTAR